MICQEDKSEPLQCLAPSNRHDGREGYKSLADNLLAFSELGELGGVNIEGLDEGKGIEVTLTTYQAKWHKSCRGNYSNTKLQCAQMRKQSTGQEAGPSTSAASTKRTRSNTTCVESIQEKLCFICHQDLGSQYKLWSGQTGILEDTTLLAQLSAGDMVARDTKYHKKCLTSLYNRAKDVAETAKRETSNETVMSSVVLAELVSYIEDINADETTAPVFKL